MTYIEFFERVSVENLCACLTQKPDRVILVGDNRKRLENHAERYKKVFLGRGMDIEFICRPINRNNVNSIVDVLSEIVNTYEDCAFGLTGGEDLCLLAMGVIFERFKNRNIQMHRFNIRSGRITDCDSDGNTIMDEYAPMLSVCENVRAYGGEVVTDASNVNYTFAWDLNDDFIHDIDSMWEICRIKPKDWNIQIGLLSAAVSPSGSEEKPKRSFMKALYGAGLLTSYSYGKNGFSVSFKNDQVKRCLTKAGQALEMKICVEAMKLRKENNEPLYNDVVNGVCIDWDGAVDPNPKSRDTENEIDVMMMHGMVPVFVSCKNGRVEDDELYKLNTVAMRFGGKYAKKVLVASDLDDTNTKIQYLKQRARDMDILIVDGVADMTDEALSKKISTFWNYSV